METCAAPAVLEAVHVPASEHHIGFFGEAVLMMELPRRHSTPPGGGRFENTISTQQAEKIWQNRKQQYEIVFQNLAFPFLVEEIHELVRCLPQSLRRHADKLQEYYALHGFPSDISDVFQRLRSLLK